MSWQATAWAQRQKTGSASRKALLMIQANYADEYGKCWPSQETMADGAELSADTVQRELREMEKLGLFSVERTRRNGRWLRTVYQLHLDREIRVERPKRKLRGAAARDAAAKASSGQITEPQPAARCEDHHAATCGPDRAATCGLDHAAPCGTNLHTEPPIEPPKRVRARFSDLVAIWPTAHVQSRRAANAEWLKVTEEERQQLATCAPAYLDDCKRERRKVCDLKTYIVERRDERFAEQSSTSSPQRVVVVPGTPQWDALRAYKVAKGATQQALNAMDARARDGKVMTAPEGWAPP